MLTSFLLPLVTLICPIASLSLPPITNQQPLSNPNTNLKTHFRDILPTDLPAITTILVEAFSPSAAWQYLMPDLQHHKPEVWTCLHDQVQHAWKTRNTSTSFGKIITVVPPPNNNNIDKTESRQENQEEEDEQEIPVSFSLWTIRTRSSSPSASQSTHSFSLPSLLTTLLTTCAIPPGTNLTRALPFARQNAAVEHKYFHLPYAHQFYLNLLATHPDWDGNGFGARHVEWGQQHSLGLDPRMPVTLLSSPAGYPLYDSLGFESVKNAMMPMLDGLGSLWFEVMRWEFGG